MTHVDEIVEDEVCEEQVLLTLQQGLEMSELLVKAPADMTPEELIETSKRMSDLEDTHLIAQEKLKKKLSALN